MRNYCCMYSGPGVRDSFRTQKPECGGWSAAAKATNQRRGDRILLHVQGSAGENHTAAGLADKVGESRLTPSLCPAKRQRSWSVHTHDIITNYIKMINRIVNYQSVVIMLALFEKQHTKNGEMFMNRCIACFTNLVFIVINLFIISAAPAGLVMASVLRWVKRLTIWCIRESYPLL